MGHPTARTRAPTLPGGRALVQPIGSARRNPRKAAAGARLSTSRRGCGQPGSTRREPAGRAGEPTVWVREPTVWVREATVWVREPTARVRGPTAWVREPTVWVREATVWVRGPTARVRGPTVRVREPTARVREATAWVREATVWEVSRPSGYASWATRASGVWVGRPGPPRRTRPPGESARMRAHPVARLDAVTPPAFTRQWRDVGHKSIRPNGCCEGLLPTSCGAETSFWWLIFRSHL